MRWLLLVALLAATPCGAWMSPVVGSGGATAAAGGGSCTLLQSADTTGASFKIGYDIADYQAGTVWQDTASTDLCQFDVKLTKTGDVSGVTYVAHVYAMSGNNLDGSSLGNSDTINGSNSWSNSWVTFTFATPVTLSADTAYGITIVPSGTSTSNFVSILTQAVDNVTQLWAGQWRSNNAAKNVLTNYENAVKVYGQ